MIDLGGRKVLITGGSRGIGAATARMFALAGASVAIHYKRQSARAAAVMEDLTSLSNAHHLSFSADLARPAEVERVFAGIRSAWGGLDCLVNNAGIWVQNALSAFDSTRYEETWAVNERAPFLCASLAVPLLRDSEDGNIVNLTSTAGQRGEAFYSPYAASKGALIAATKSWSTELAPEIRVNSVAPGWVDTEMCLEPFAGEGRKKIESTIPLGRVASVEDIAGPVLFLASPLARHITGEILNVNGGSVLVG